MKAPPQQGEHRQDAQAAFGEFKQAEKQVRDGAFPGHRAAGDGEGDPGGAAPVPGRRRRRVENGLDQGRIPVHVRRHDQDIGGQQVRVFREEGKNLVVENLDFPHRAVAGVDLDGPVHGVDGAFFRIRFQDPFPQVQDVRLDCPQQRFFARVLENFPLLAGQVRQPPQEVAALRAQGCQQAVSRLQEKVFRGDRDLPRGGPEFLHGPVRFAVRADLAPELAAGIEEKEADVPVRRQRVERLEMKMREPGYAEQGDPAGHTGLRRKRVSHSFQKTLPEKGRVGMALVPPQPPPEFGLPGFVVHAAPAAFPGDHHVGAEDEVLVEEVGDAPGKLIALDVLRVVFDVAADGCECRVVQAVGQRFHDFPLQGRRVAGGRRKGVGQDRAEHFVQEGVGEREADVGADAVAAGQFHGEPARHSRALHHDRFRGQGIGPGIPDAFGQAAGENFQPVADEAR